MTVLSVEQLMDGYTIECARQSPTIKLIISIIPSVWAFCLRGHETPSWEAPLQLSCTICFGVADVVYIIFEATVELFHPILIQLMSSCSGISAAAIAFLVRQRECKN